MVLLSTWHGLNFRLELRPLGDPFLLIGTALKSTPIESCFFFFWVDYRPLNSEM